MRRAATRSASASSAPAAAAAARWPTCSRGTRRACASWRWPTCSPIALEQALKRLSQQYGARAAVKPEHVFTGFDAYQKVLAVPEVNYVILATPPGFRPTHLEAAIKAGKHIFTEKPVAVDGPGIRKVLALAEGSRRQEALRRRRHAAPPPARLHRDDEAHPRRRDRRHRVGARLLEPGLPLEARSPAGVDATWSGSCATGSTSPGSPATTSSSSTSTTST